jgi:uncharacterized protein (TIGR02266 family)
LAVGRSAGASDHTDVGIDVAECVIEEMRANRPWIDACIFHMAMNEHPVVRRKPRTDGFRTRSGDDVVVDVALDATSDHTLWCDLGMELERSGVFVATYHRVRVGTRVLLDVRLPGHQAPLALRGVVRWTRPHLEGSDGAPGIGVELVEVAEAARDALRAFAQNVREPMMFDVVN